ncbi:unnamed protein product [Caenorhabditis bovis]|uniref:Uncharacterized protein n=1 Tax=Caenorhabditis bovis TaxID=2654633 RepID=A0A8S1F7C4_9PELO|nr:unnamed protein product [Caenorhabditis bovis]
MTPHVYSSILLILLLLQYAVIVVDTSNLLNAYFKARNAHEIVANNLLSSNGRNIVEDYDHTEAREPGVPYQKAQSTLLSTQRKCSKFFQGRFVNLKHPTDSTEVVAMFPYHGFFHASKALHEVKRGGHPMVVG